MSRTATSNPEPRVVKTTRIPARLHAYMKSLASLQFGTLGKMHVTMLRTFLRESPWTRYGLAWRSTRATSDKSDDTGGMRATGWEQVNLSLPSELASEIEIVAEVEGVSVSSIIYTACYWWCWYVYPPRQQVEHRRRRSQIESLAVDLVAEDEPLKMSESRSRPGLEGTTRKTGSERSGSPSRGKGATQKADAEKPASPKPVRTARKASSERSGSPSRKKQPAQEKPKSRPRRKLERPQRKTRR